VRVSLAVSSTAYGEAITMPIGVITMPILAITMPIPAITMRRSW
jgi:hypothetical protein